MTNAGLNDAFVAKVDPGTATYVYSTFVGGTGDDDAASIAIDSSGNAYITGITYSSDFPLVGAVDSTFNTSGFGDVYVAKIAPDGTSFSFSTYLGGEDQGIGQAIAINSNGQIFVAGNTNSTDFPVSAGIVQSACGDSSGCAIGDGFVASYGAPTSSGPALTPLPGSLAFGNVATATTSTKVVQIKNTGTTTLNLSTIAISGTDAASFAINAGQTNCTNGTALAADSTCNIAIDFSPVAEVSYSASLDVASNDSNSPAHIALTGTGAPAIPGISVNPTSLSFGNVTVNGSSTKLVTVTNDGTAPLTISVSGITIKQSGTEYAIAAGTTCVPGTPIAINASCTIGVTLSPGSATTFTGTLNIVSDAPTSPTQIALSGTGMVSAAKIDVSPASLDFGTAQVGSVINYPVTVTNTGTEDLIISAITVGGTDAGNFVSPAAGSTCTVGGHIVPNANCIITTDFHAAAIATYNATLTITSNAANAPTASGPLTGKGSDFQFGVQTGGSLTSTVTPGQTATFPLQIGSTTGAAGTATLGCIETIPNAICGVTPTSVTLNDTTPSNFTVSVVTLNSANSVPGPTPRGPMSMPPSWMWMAAAMLVLGMMVKTQRRARLAMVAAMLFVMLWSSCVGNAPRSVTPNITPSGTYTVTATATVNGVVKTQALTVIVQ